MYLSLGSAWQVIDRLRRMGHPPELQILQRVLYLCSKHKEQPDVAAQVTEDHVIYYMKKKNWFFNVFLKGTCVCSCTGINCHIFQCISCPFRS